MYAIRSYYAVIFPAAAAAVGALAIAMWFLAVTREAPVEPSPEPVSPQVAFSSTPVEPIERGVAEPLRQPENRKGELTKSPYNYRQYQQTFSNVLPSV